ncbi:MAG: response regulator [Planctomycetota bacterium]
MSEQSFLFTCASHFTSRRRSRSGVKWLGRLGGRARIADLPSPASAGGEAPARLPQGLRILVAEDTDVNQLLLQTILERQGCQVTVVPSGEAAIEIYEQQQFDVVLLDFELPGINGRATADALRRVDAKRNKPAPPMVCVTAHAGPTAEAVDEGFDGRLTKPFRQAELIESLANLANSPASSTLGRASESGPELYKSTLRDELTEAFLAVADDQLRQLRYAIEQGDHDEARVFTHRSRGQVAYFEMPSLEAKLQHFEHSCSQSENPSIRAEAATLLTMLEEAISSIREPGSQPCQDVQSTSFA